MNRARLARAAAALTLLLACPGDADTRPGD